MSTGSRANKEARRSKSFGQFDQGEGQRYASSSKERKSGGSKGSSSSKPRANAESGGVDMASVRQAMGRGRTKKS